MGRGSTAVGLNQNEAVNTAMCNDGELGGVGLNQTEIVNIAMSNGSLGV